MKPWAAVDELFAIMPSLGYFRILIQTQKLFKLNCLISSSKGGLSIK